MPDNINFAENLIQAKQKNEEFRDKDPLPEIDPALLNSADIMDYVRYTGMIFPFNNSDEFFKPASYSIKFNGHYLYWDFIDGKLKRVEETLKDGESFILKSNSIAYITLEPLLQLPHYIAARFNLQIKHVYRGLILGTGPLVDPGFSGTLNIPLHNLTGENYIIQNGEPIIWMEFTKLSKNQRWTKLKKDNYKQVGKFVEFKQSSKNISLSDYIHKAEPNTPIQSSIPKAISEFNEHLKETNDVLEDSVKNNKRTNSLLKWFSVSLFLGIAGIIGAVGGYYYNAYNVGKISTDFIIKTEKSNFDNQNTIIELNKKVKLLEIRIDSIEKRELNRKIK